MTMDLAREFDFIKRTYFPKWDPGDKWRIKCKPLEQEAGKHNPKTKTITISSSVNGPKLSEAIIHEISHAVEGRDHSIRWQARLLEAAGTAEFLGEHALANEIKEDIAYHRWSQIVPDAAIALLDPDYDIQFKDFARWMAKRYGLALDELETELPDIERAFNAARANAGELMDRIRQIRPRPR